MYIRNLFTCCLVGLILTGCAGSKHSNQPTKTYKNIAVLPFVGNDNTNAPFAGDKESGLRALTAILHEQFAHRNDINMLSDHEAISMVYELPNKPALWAKKIGVSKGSDTVLTVRLIRFQERQGGELAVNHPASVAFDFRLLATDTGETICFGRFDKTQKPLTDNILRLNKSLKRGFKWLKAEQLLHEGVVDSFAGCKTLHP